MGKSEESKTAERGMSGFLPFCKKLVRKGVNALFPEALVCLDCGCELTDSDRTFSLCPSCRDKLPYITGTRCRYCGEPVEQKYDVCRHCQISLPYFDKVYAPFAYEGVIKKIILNYKDGSDNYLYRYTAKFLADYYNGMELSCDAVCYVPSGKDKILRRGFEHNRKVAEAFAKTVGKPLVFPLAVVKKVKDQTRKNRVERFKGIRGVFGVRKGADRNEICGKRLLLIDDVVTTGATAGECARVLKQELGASEVTVLALARS